MKKLHNSITYSFLPVGHTKFSPDWCFGLFKQKLRKTPVSDLDDIAHAITQSAEVNQSQLVGTQDGMPIVPTYNWQKHLLPHFKKFPTIKKWHKFSIKLNEEGDPVVQVQQYSDTKEISLDIVKNKLPLNMPDIIQPKGLSLDRRGYLYEKIRQYCSDPSKDKVCPKPTESSIWKEPANQDEIDHNDEDSEQEWEPQPKRPRKATTCRKCGQLGHNIRTCSNK